MTSKAWHAVALEQYRAGSNCNEIGERIGVNFAIVSAFLRSIIPADEYRELKRANKRRAALGAFSDDQRRRWRELADTYVTEDVSVGELAKRHGISRAVVHYALELHVAPDVYRRLSKERFRSRMRGNKNGLGHKPSARHMAMLKARIADANPAWKGNTAAKTTGNSRASRLFPLAGKTCEACPAPAQVRHHIDENTFNNVPENIQFLCRACHARHHLRLRNRAA